eukprot:12079156-Ditylum_brightwellii.AAC.1
MSCVLSLGAKDDISSGVASLNYKSSVETDEEHFRGEKPPPKRAKVAAKEKEENFVSCRSIQSKHAVDKFTPATTCKEQTEMLKGMYKPGQAKTAIMPKERKKQSKKSVEVGSKESPLNVGDMDSKPAAVKDSKAVVVEVGSKKIPLNAGDIDLKPTAAKDSKAVVVEVGGKESPLNDGNMDLKPAAVKDSKAGVDNGEEEGVK